MSSKAISHRGKLIVQESYSPSMALLMLLCAAGNYDAVAANDMPYQITDGKVDNNTLEGWKTYNGGGCGGCHGCGGSGGVAADLAESPVLKNEDWDRYKDYVTNGYPGSLMKPHSNDGRVMEKLDNLFDYLKARAGGVLGPENLLRHPPGKLD